MDGWKSIDAIVAIGKAVAAGLALFAGLVALFWRKCRSLCRAISLSDRLHLQFGDADPAESIKSAIEKLRHANSEKEIIQRIVAAHLGIALYVCDPGGRCTWCNEVLADLFGCDQGDILGAGWLSYVAEEQRRGVWDTWMYAIQHCTPYNAHYEIMTDGGRKWIKTTAYAVVVDEVTICFVGYCKAVNPTDGNQVERMQ